MKTRENRFSIRKLSVGASSVVVATLLFMEVAQHRQPRNNRKWELLKRRQHNLLGIKTHATQKGQVQSTEQDKSQASQTENNTNNSQTSLHNEHNQTDDASTTNETTTTSNETHQSTTVKSEKPAQIAITNKLKLNKLLNQLLTTA